MTNNLTYYFHTNTSTHKYLIFSLILVLSAVSMANKLQLVRDLASENSQIEVFKDIAAAGGGGGADADIKLTVLCSSDELSVTRVEHNDTSFIIKQFNSCAVDPKRSLMIEYKALELRYKALPLSVPQPYLLSDKHNCIVMEDLKPYFASPSEQLKHVVLRPYVSLLSLLTSGEIEEQALQSLVSIISTLHKYSSEPERLQQLANDFMTNPDTERVLRERYVQTFSKETVNRLSGTPLGGRGVERLGSDEVGGRVAELYKAITANRQTLVHGNFNANNILVHAGTIKLVGNHFSMLGPCALDIGTLLAQYLATYHVHMLTEQNNDAHRQVAYRMITAATNLIDGYMKEMSDVFEDEEKRKEFVSSVAGFSGVELVNWAVSEASSTAAEAVLDTGLRLITASHRIHSASVLVNIALMLTT